MRAARRRGRAGSRRSRVGVRAGQAADECKGLQVCIPVAGPWVAIPPAGAGAPRARPGSCVCPEGVVGGVDARVSELAVAVEFPGRIGSPVNPGITTTESLVFQRHLRGPGAQAHELPAVHRLHSRRRRRPRTPTAFTRA